MKPVLGDLEREGPSLVPTCFRYFTTACKSNPRETDISNIYWYIDSYLHTHMKTQVHIIYESFKKYWGEVGTL